MWAYILKRLLLMIPTLFGILLTCLISVPLGIAKAVRGGTAFDTATTFMVLLGYAIPSFVLGVVLLVYFAGGTFMQWFPLRGIVSSNWQELDLFHKVTDYFW